MYIRNLNQITEAAWAALTGDVDYLDYAETQGADPERKAVYVDKSYSPDPTRELEEIEEELLIEGDHEVIRKLKVRRRVLREQLKEESRGN